MKKFYLITLAFITFLTACTKEQTHNKLNTSRVLMLVVSNQIERGILINVENPISDADTVNLHITTTNQFADYQSTFTLNSDITLLSRTWYNYFPTQSSEETYLSCNAVDLNTKSEIVYYNESDFHVTYQYPEDIDQLYESWNRIRDLKIVNEFRDNNNSKISAFRIWKKDPNTNNDFAPAIPHWHFVFGKEN